MRSLTGIRRRALAGGALVAMLLPGAGAMAQDTAPAELTDLPPCTETVQGRGDASEYSGSITSTSKAFGVTATLRPGLIVLADGYAFADDAAPLLIFTVPPGALTKPEGGEIDASFTPPVLMRGGEIVKGHMAVNVSGEGVTASADSEQPEEGDERSYSFSLPNSAFAARDPLFTIAYTADNQTVATLSYSAAPVQAASSAYEAMRRSQLARYDAGQCAPASQGCFLTTAACEVVGLADDCWELRTLRRFRDGWLAKQADGRADIARYYAQAPAIADRLRADRKAALKLYWTRIVPSALAAQLGLNRAARAIYTRGMRELVA